MKAEVVFFYSYDVAYELPLEAIARSVGTAAAGGVRPETSAPRELLLERCVHFDLDPVHAGDAIVTIGAELYDFGVVSLALRTSANAARLLDLVRWHDPALPGGKTIDGVAREALDAVLRRIGPHVERGSVAPEEPEAYTVFRIAPSEVGLEDAEHWLAAHGREVAALLVGERDPARLSEAVIAQTLKHRFSYWRDDLAVVDWDAALVVEKGAAADVLRVVELANLQLVEYRHYDAVLDRVVDRAYGDLGKSAKRPFGFFGIGEQVRKLRELRINLSEVAEEISNATKFFGDWHLARLYMGCAARFHLPEWKASVEAKLGTLDELYRLAVSETTNRRMLTLEAIIVVLFVTDLLLLAFLPFR